MSGKSLVVRPFAVAALSCLVLATQSPAQDATLTAQRVVAEAQTALQKVEEDDSWAKLMLAQAQTYLGDRAGAWKTLGPPVSDDLLQWTAYLSCAEIEIELMDAFTPLPQQLHDEHPDATDYILAKAYAERGDAKRCIEHLSKIPASGTVTLHSAAKEIVPLLLAGGHREEARRALEMQSKCYLTAWSMMATDAGPEDLVLRYTELGDMAAATDFCREWQGKLETATDVKDMGVFIGQTWARLGQSYFLAGDRQAGEESLRRALYWFDEAVAAKADRMEPIISLEFAEALATIASRQRRVLGDDASRATYNRAFAFADAATGSEFGGYGYVKIVRRLVAADDVVGTRWAIERAQSPRDQAKCWQELADRCVSRGLFAEAAKAARLGAEALAKEAPQTGDADTAMRLAKCLARAQEPDAARELFIRAKEYSALDGNQKYHWMIARWEAQSGLHAEAYATTQAIPDAATRPLPLAELALQMARAEARAKLERP